METHRRTEVGRVRTAREFVANFFPYGPQNATDKLFYLIPNDVRGPVLAQWGIRGGKAALKDDDEKVRHVVHDALVAGDIDETTFEEGVNAQILVDWVQLPDWWSFWRQGKLTGLAIQRALATARELELIDDRWFLNNIQGRGGKLKGTDVVCDTLSKDQVVAWMRKLHDTGDGSPAGLIGSLGWETVLAKTAQDALLFALDAFARKTGLAAEVAEAPAPVSRRDPPVSRPEPSPLKQDSGFPIAIPEIPAVDAADEDAPSIASLTSTQDTGLWGAAQGGENIAEARAKMMEMLNEPAPESESGWGAAASEPPAKPSGLDWGEPPPASGDTAGSKPSAPPPLPSKKPLGPTPRR